MASPGSIMRAGRGGARRRLSPEARYRVMSSIMKTNTRPERVLRSALWAVGLRGWRCHVRSLPGTPDIAFLRARVAVHVDGVFWHGHPRYFKPARLRPYWRVKINGNRLRD